jgi:hypothetical protein
MKKTALEHAWKKTQTLCARYYDEKICPTGMINALFFSKPVVVLMNSCVSFNLRKRIHIIISL